MTSRPGGIEPAPANRLLRAVSLVGALELLGYACLLLAILVLSSPVAAPLFATDGNELGASLDVLRQAGRLVIGLVGLALLLAARSRRLAGRSLLLRVGDLLLLGVAAAAALGAGEVWLRVQGWQEWGSATRTPLTPAEMTRGRGLPLLAGVFAQRARSDFDPEYDRLLLFHVNRYGLRGLTPVMPKPAGRVRIVALGGSTTFGYAVADGEDWPSQLARLLGGPYEVLNAGRPGATSYRNFAYLRDHLLRLEPDIVLLYEGFNDMWRAVRRHGGEQPDYGIVDEGLPGNVQPLEQGSPAPWPPRLSFLAYRGAHWLGNRLGPRRPAPPPPSVEPRPFRFDPAVVGIYERNLGAMVRLCRSRGVVPVLLTFAACDDASSPRKEQRRRLAYVLREIPELDPTGAHEALELYREITRRVARDEEAPLVDLARSMTKDLSAYVDTVHFTPAGERTLATLLARELPRAYGSVTVTSPIESEDGSTASKAPRSGRTPP